MNSQLFSALQKCNSPEQTIQGVIQYYNIHTQKVGAAVESFSNYVNDGSFTDNLPATDVLVLDAGLSGTDNKVVVQVGAVKDALETYLSDESAATDVSVAVSDVLGTVSSMNLEEVLDRLSDSFSVSQGLLATLSGVVEALRSNVGDVMDIIYRHIENLNVKEYISSSIKAGLNSISLSVGSLSQGNLPSCVPAILKIFGITSSTTEMYDSEISTYSGINAMTAVLSDFFGDIATAVAQLPAAIVNVLKILGSALASLCYFMSEKLLYWIVKQVRTTSGTNDALNSLENGDGSVAVDYSYHLAYDTDSSMTNTLNLAFAEVESDNLQILLPTGSIYVTRRSNQGGFDFCIIPKVLNPAHVSACFYKHFGFYLNEYLQFSWKYSEDDNLYYTHATTLNVTASIGDVVDWLADLFGSDELYTIDKWQSFDSYLATGVMCSQGITSILLQLYSKAALNQWDNATTFKAILNDSRGCIPAALLQQLPTYDFDNDKIKVTNYVMGKICCSMTHQSSAFDTAANSNTETWSTGHAYGGYIPQIVDLCTNVILSTSVSGGTGGFVPYSGVFIQPKSSWYIPTDQQNQSTVKAWLKRGAIVLAVVVALFVGAKILKKVRMKSFDLAAQAGSLSWKAAETGDPTLMAQAYKMEKRARLLSKISGVASSSMSSVSSTPGSNTLITNVGVKIDPNF